MDSKPVPAVPAVPAVLSYASVVANGVPPKVSAKPTVNVAEEAAPKAASNAAEVAALLNVAEVAVAKVVEVAVVAVAKVVEVAAVKAAEEAAAKAAANRDRARQTAAIKFNDAFNDAIKEIVADRAATRDAVNASIKYLDDEIAAAKAAEEAAAAKAAEEAAVKAAEVAAAKTAEEAATKTAEEAAVKAAANRARARSLNDARAYATQRIQHYVEIAATQNAARDEAMAERAFQAVKAQNATAASQQAQQAQQAQQDVVDRKRMFMLKDPRCADLASDKIDLNRETIADVLGNLIISNLTKITPEQFDILTGHHHDIVFTSITNWGNFLIVRTAMCAILAMLGEPVRNVDIAPFLCESEKSKEFSHITKSLVTSLMLGGLHIVNRGLIESFCTHNNKIIETFNSWRAFCRVVVYSNGITLDEYILREISVYKLEYAKLTLENARVAHEAEINRRNAAANEVAINNAAVASAILAANIATAATTRAAAILAATIAAAAAAAAALAASAFLEEIVNAAKRRSQRIEDSEKEALRKEHALKLQQANDAIDAEFANSIEEANRQHLQRLADINKPYNTIDIDNVRSADIVLVVAIGGPIIVDGEEVNVLVAIDGPIIVDGEEAIVLVAKDGPIIVEGEEFGECRVNYGLYCRGPTCRCTSLRR